MGKIKTFNNNPAIYTIDRMKANKLRLNEFPDHSFILRDTETETNVFHICILSVNSKLNVVEWMLIIYF